MLIIQITSMIMSALTAKIATLTTIHQSFTC